MNDPREHAIEAVGLAVVVMWSAQIVAVAVQNPAASASNSCLHGSHLLFPGNITHCIFTLFGSGDSHAT